MKYSPLYHNNAFTQHIYCMQHICAAHNAHILTTSGFVRCMQRIRRAYGAKICALQRDALLHAARITQPKFWGLDITLLYIR